MKHLNQNKNHVWTFREISGVFWASLGVAPPILSRYFNEWGLLHLQELQ